VPHKLQAYTEQPVSTRPILICASLIYVKYQDTYNVNKTTTTAQKPSRIEARKGAKEDGAVTSTESESPRPWLSERKFYSVTLRISRDFTENGLEVRADGMRCFCNVHGAIRPSRVQARVR
jgi:hypothetical protein